MNPTLAELTKNYVFQRVVRGRVQSRPNQLIRVRSAVYDAANETVTLTTAKRLNLHQIFQITASGISPQGLENVSGVPLDGKGNGSPGSSFVLRFGGPTSLKGIPAPGNS
jgi:hypothetical protein